MLSPLLPLLLLLALPFTSAALICNPPNAIRGFPTPPSTSPPDCAALLARLPALEFRTGEQGRHSKPHLTIPKVAYTIKLPARIVHRSCELTLSLNKPGRVGHYTPPASDVQLKLWAELKEMAQEVLEACIRYGCRAV